MALKVLSALDAAKTQYYHFKAIIVAGMGLFTDAYDLFCLPPIMKLLGRIYYKHRPHSHQYQIPATVSTVMVTTALLGTVIGQLVFGHLGDRIGRRRVYGLCLMLMVLSSIGCGFSVGTSRTYVLLTLGFFRFMLGVGIGGDYPLSATIMSEFSNRRTRGAFIAAVFSMQGFGILLSSTVTMVVCAAFDRATKALPGRESPEAADLAWRLIVMIAAVPAGLTYYWRLMMPETARWTALVERNVRQAAIDMQEVLSVSLGQIAEELEEEEDGNQQASQNTTHAPHNAYSFFSKEFLRRHGRDLFACAAAWFLVDIVFYSNSLFQSEICLGYLPEQAKINAFQEAFHVAKLQAVIAICSTIPGYYATVFVIDRVGRVKIQLMGFLFMALGLLAMAIPYQKYWQNNTNIAFMFLYGLTFFATNFGPNTTTFIVPAELFPARFRSTCHGISGAAGKIGAIIGSVGFLWASQSQREIKGISMTAVLVALAGVCAVGMMVTYFFTRETTGRSLEENENEDETNGVCFLRCIADPCTRPQSPRDMTNV